MRTVFVYESLSAGGLGDDPPPSLRAEGWAMLSAVAADFAKVARVSTLLLPGLPPLADIDVTRSTSAEEPRLFREAVLASDATLVIAPEFDDILARRSDETLALDCRLLGCHPTAIRLTADKWTLACHWLAVGVPTPETHLATSIPPREFPVVLKPRDGAGSQATQRVDRPDDWASSLAAVREEMPGRDFLVQPLVPGRACSVAFLIGPSSRLPLAACEQNLSDDGRFQYRGGRTPLNLDESRRAVALASRALADIDGLAGYVGVDLILGERDVVIEVNPRLTTSYIGLRALCRDNLADAWLRTLAGESISLTWRDDPIEYFADGRLAW